MAATYRMRRWRWLDFPARIEPLTERALNQWATDIRRLEPTMRGLCVDFFPAPIHPLQELGVSPKRIADSNLLQKAVRGLSEDLIPTPRRYRRHRGSKWKLNTGVPGVRRLPEPVDRLSKDLLPSEIEPIYQWCINSGRIADLQNGWSGKGRLTIELKLWNPSEIEPEDERPFLPIFFGQHCPTFFLELMWRGRWLNFPAEVEPVHKRRETIVFRKDRRLLRKHMKTLRQVPGFLFGIEPPSNTNGRRVGNNDQPAAALTTCERVAAGRAV